MSPWVTEMTVKRTLCGQINRVKKETSNGIQSNTIKGTEKGNLSKYFFKKVTQRVDENPAQDEV